MCAKDLFSRQSDAYARFRPTYPQAWFDWLKNQLESHQLAWDVGTGNGQVAHALATFNESVIATDLSEQQLIRAEQHPRITYQQAFAHESPCADQSCDLITVAQALHWFDLPKFYAEVGRVLKPGGVLAVWGYELCYLEDERRNQAFLDWYRGPLDPHWAPERKHLENRYEDLPFPYEMIDVPDFSPVYRWTAEQFRGYLESWSAVDSYRHENCSDPFDLIDEALWEDWPAQGLQVTFPLFFKVGRKPVT